jgi:hypothetical protein
MFYTRALRYVPFLLQNVKLLDLSKQKTALFIPSLHYLSNPVFIPVAQKMQGIKKVYLDAEYTMNKKYINDYPAQLKYLSQFFDEVSALEYEVPTTHSSKFTELSELRKKSIDTINAIERVNPDVIILGSDATDVFKICNTFFKRKKIYVIQQSALRPFVEKQYSFKEKLSYLLYKYVLKVPILASNPWIKYTDNSIHFLWSDFFFLNPHKKYIATGNPAWDKVLSAFDGKYGYSSNRNIVCFATQPNFGTIEETIYVEFIEMVKEVIKLYPQLQFIIKVHPRENIEIYKKLFSTEEFDNVHIEKEEPIDKVLDRCFLLITGWSMSGYESIIKGIPVILGNPGNKMDFSYLNPDNMLPVASSLSVFSEEIKKLMQPNGYHEFLKERTKFLKKINTYDEPLSAEKIVESIRKDIF